MTLIVRLVKPTKKQIEIYEGKFLLITIQFKILLFKQTNSLLKTFYLKMRFQFRMLKMSHQTNRRLNLLAVLTQSAM